MTVISAASKASAFLLCSEASVKTIAPSRAERLPFQASAIQS